MEDNKKKLSDGLKALFIVVGAVVTIAAIAITLYNIFKKYFKINKTTGKVTVKKGLKKGTYKIKVKVSAAGDNNYKSGNKTVTLTIKVK